MVRRCPHGTRKAQGEMMGDDLNHKYVLGMLVLQCLNIFHSLTSDDDMLKDQPEDAPIQIALDALGIPKAERESVNSVRKLILQIVKPLHKGRKHDTA